MAIQKIKEGNSFNSYTQIFQIDSANDLATIESGYNPHFGDKAELPNGTVYVRHSDGYSGDLWEIAQGSGGGSSGSSLPDVTSDDNGDVLTVVEGAWAKAAPSGGASLSDVCDALISINSAPDDDSMVVDSYNIIKGNRTTILAKLANNEPVLVVVFEKYTQADEHTSMASQSVCIHTDSDLSGALLFEMTSGTYGNYKWDENGISFL